MQHNDEVTANIKDDLMTSLKEKAQQLRDAGAEFDIDAVMEHLGRLTEGLPDKIKPITEAKEKLDVFTPTATGKVLIDGKECAVTVTKGGLVLIDFSDADAANAFYENLKG